MPQTAGGGQPGPDPDQGDVTQGWLTRPVGRAVRYVTALGIIVAAVVVSLNGRFTICETIDSAKDGITTTCAPPELNQAGVLAVVALVLALLWPDIQEVSVFGVTVKRLIEKVGRRVDEVGATSTQIRDTVTTTNVGVDRLQASLGSQDTQLNDILVGLRGLGDRMAVIAERPEDGIPWGAGFSSQLAGILRSRLGPAELDDRLHALESSLSDRGPRDLPSPADPRRALLIGELLELWRLLGGSAAPGAGEQGARWTTAPGQRPNALRLLERLVRALLRGEEVSDDDLMTAVIMLRWMLRD